MLVDLAFAHVQKFRAAGDEQRQHPTLFMLGVFAVQVLPVVLDDARPCHLREELFERLALHFGELHQLLGRLGLAHAHFERDVDHLVGHHAGKAPVLGVVRRGLEADAVRDHTAELEHVFARGVRAGNFEIQFTLVEREIRGLAAVDIAHVPALLFRGVPRACRRAANIARRSSPILSKLYFTGKCWIFPLTDSINRSHIAQFPAFLRRSAELPKFTGQGTAAQTRAHWCF